MKTNCLYDKLVPINQIKKHPKNRNKHPREQLERLAKILEYQGWRYPVKISKRSGFVTSGHGRLAAAKLNGWKTVPVNFQDYENDEQEYADLQADNAIASWSEMDLEQIKIDLKDMGDLDIDMLGVKDFGDDPAKPKPGCDEDEVPDVKKVKTKLGQIYQLGNHRLKCGDSTNHKDVVSLMGQAKADMVFTDPPYNTGMQGAKKGSKARLSNMFNDSFTEDEWNTLLRGMCDSYFWATKENAMLYVCLDWRRSHELVPYLKELFKFSNLIVWDKMVHGLGSDYKYTHEFIHVCKKGSPNVDTHQGEQEYQDIWHVQRKMGKDEEHATKKPIELVERAIKHASQDGQIVLDLFGGSGSTLIACEKTNRKCFMMELDPHYCDVIVARWERYTGKKASLIK